MMNTEIANLNFHSQLAYCLTSIDFQKQP